MDTENRAVVRIFSWYVTWWRQSEESMNEKRVKHNTWLVFYHIYRFLPGRWRRPGWTERRTAGCSAACRSQRGWPASVFPWVCGRFPDAGCCSELERCNLRNGNKQLRLWITDDEWRFCGDEEEDIMHLFWYCPDVVLFGTRWLCEPGFDLSLVSFGVFKKNKICC